MLASPASTPRHAPIAGSILKVLISLVAMALAIVPLAQAQHFIVLHSFTNADGLYPYAGVTLDAAGNIYGTTQGGGLCGDCGTVFKIDPSGTYTVLYSFTGTNGDGLNPRGVLVSDGAGNLYGTTSGGGIYGDPICNGIGCGTVFQLDSSGKETVLYQFTGGVDGATPNSGLIRDSSGNLYGTTYLGGANNWGTLFQVDTSGNETVIFNFNGPTGGDVQGGLVRDVDGNFYGTTTNGGNNEAACHGFGCGTVYQITPGGTENVMYYFTGSGDGAQPGGEALILDEQGDLFGTSQGEGGSLGWGTVFKVHTTGGFSVLHTFRGPVKGSEPWAGVIRDGAGNLYGTTLGGGIRNCISGCGTVFKLGPNGAYKVLHQFTGGADGFNPFGALARDKAGNLYGVAQNGGSSGGGVVFKIVP